MDHTIVKIRTRERHNKYRKLLSDIKLYMLPDNIENTVPYSPDHNLDEDDWFVIKEFSEKDYCLPFLKDEFTSISYGVLQKDEFEKIDYLCYIEDNGRYFFQKVSKSALLSKKRITLGDMVKYSDSSSEIIIQKEPDAIYLKEKDCLYFRKLEAIAGIFKGIDTLYREATEEETEKFLGQKFIELEGFTAKHVKQANRKRIAMVGDMLGKMEKKKKRIILDSFKEYCPELLTEKGRLKVSSENDLKLVLYGLDQRFYTTPDGEEKRIANSIIRIS